MRPSRVVNSTGPSMERSSDSLSLPRAISRVVNLKDPVIDTRLSKRHITGWLNSSPEASVLKLQGKPRGIERGQAPKREPAQVGRGGRDVEPSRPEFGDGLHLPNGPAVVPDGIRTETEYPADRQFRKAEPGIRNRRTALAPGRLRDIRVLRKKPFQRHIAGLNIHVGLEAVAGKKTPSPASGTAPPARRGRRKPPGSPSRPPQGRKPGSGGDRGAPTGSGSPPLPAFRGPGSVPGFRDPPKSPCLLSGFENNLSEIQQIFPQTSDVRFP